MLYSPGLISCRILTDTDLKCSSGGAIIERIVKSEDPDQTAQITRMAIVITGCKTYFPLQNGSKLFQMYPSTLISI